MKTKALILSLLLLVLLTACSLLPSGSGTSAGPSESDAPRTESQPSTEASSRPGPEDGSTPSAAESTPEAEPVRPAPAPGESLLIPDGSGTQIYFPGGDEIAVDQESGISYLKGIILLTLLHDPDEETLSRLAATAGGEVVGVQSGQIPLAEIRVPAEDYASLSAAADALADLPGVAFASPELLLTGDVQAINTLTEDKNSWSADGTVIADKGNEYAPSGPDWWAEAIRAYSAWEGISRLEDPIPAGIFDNGFDLSLPELVGARHLNIAEMINSPIMRPDLTVENGASHGTFVAGILTAANNEAGIRGVADQSPLYCVDRLYEVMLSPTSEAKNYTLTEGMLAFYYKEMHDRGVRVINHSFGLSMITMKEFFHSDNTSYSDKTRETISKASQNHNGNYDAYAAAFRRTAEALAGMMLRIILTEWMNGCEDWIYVQSAGNGSTGDSTPTDAGLNGFFASITLELFTKELLELKEKSGLSEEQRARLDTLSWEALRSRILVVGSAKNDPVSDKEYRPAESSNAGEAVDIFAPGVDVFGINYAGAAKPYLAEDGTSVAAPMVCGAATLLWSAFPDLPADEISQILKECTDRTVTDAFGFSHPFLNVGQAVEYTKYYTYVRDRLIPAYGLFKGAQLGTMKTADTNWLKSEGLVAAWIGDIDPEGDTGHEMVVFRFKRDPDSPYSDRRYLLLMDLYTLVNGQVELQDTEVRAGFSLRSNYSYDLDLEVFAYRQTAGTELMLRIDAVDHLYGQSPVSDMRRIYVKDGRLLVEDGAPAGTQQKRIFAINCDRTGDRDFLFRITDGTRFTYYLDFVFTDRDYLPSGMASDFIDPDVQAGTVLPGEEWINPPFAGTGTRIIREESYEDNVLKSYFQYAYAPDGRLLLRGYFHSDGTLSSVIRYEYDRSGFLIRETEILANGAVNNDTVYENDENGFRIRAYHVSPEGGPVSDWNEYTNDAAGNRIRWDGYRKGVLSFYWIYTFDAQNNHIGTERYEADGTLTLKSESVFDSAGHVLRNISTNEKGISATTEFEWRDDFHVRYSPWYYSNNGKLAGYDTYTYDDNKDLISYYSWYDSDGHTTETKYYYQQGDGSEPVKEPDPSSETPAATTEPIETIAPPTPEAWPPESVRRHLEAVSDTSWYRELGNNPNNVKAFRSNLDSVIVADDTHLYFTEVRLENKTTHYRIMRTDLNGQNKEYVTEGRGGLNLKDGWLYYHVREEKRSRIERLNLTSGAKEVLGSPEEGQITSMLVSGDYIFYWLWFSDKTYGYVQALDCRSGRLITLGGGGADWGAPMSVSEGCLTVISQLSFGQGERAVYRVAVSEIEKGATLEKVVSKSDFLFANSFFFTEDGTVRVAANDAFGTKVYYYHASYSQIRDGRWAYQSDERRMTMNLNEAKPPIVPALISAELHFILGEDLILITVSDLSVTGGTPGITVTRFAKFDLSSPETVAQYDGYLGGAGTSMDGQTLFVLLSDPEGDYSISRIGVLKYDAQPDR